MSIALGQSKALPDQPLPPPPPPPKSQDSSSSRNSPNLPSASFPPLLPPIDASASFDSLSPRSATDPNLATAPSPSAASSPTDQRPKKQNPLVDLIETEKQYVEQLTGIIRKVAAAWSRSNLPPPELDLMFRSIEAIYKANRSLFSRLKDIGTNPSSPKALGDLLMRWIDDLDAPYAAYCERYCTGFDDWPPVLATERLPSTLATFSGVTPPPSGGVWTLDELFLLPKGRLKYYRKLYGRLLKGTQPGRSDHKLLVAAADKLERLLATVDARARVRVGTEEAASPLPAAPPVMEDEVVVDMRARERDGDVSKPQSPPNGPTGSETSESNRTSNFSSANRHSEDSAALPVIQATIPELETKLAIDRCVDIFTMQPKQVKLQLLPPNLAFRREVRLAFETSMSLTPSKSPETIRYPRGRVFILSDLVLIAEADANGDMFLLFPPLSGKFLKVTRAAGGANNVMEVSVMKKETLVLELVSASLCERVLDDFQECIDFARATHSAAKHPVPPLPAGLPRGGPGGPLPSSQTAPELNRSSASPQSPPPNGAPHRVSSPPNSLSPTNSGTFSPPRFGSPVTSERDEILSGGMAPMRMQDGPVQMQMQMGAQRVPALHDAAGAPQRTSSQGQVEDAGPLPPMPGGPQMGPPQPGQVFGPGQIMPGGGAFGGPPGPGQQFGPGMIMGRGPGGPPMGMQGRPGPGPGSRQVSGGMGSPMDPRGPPPMGMNGPPPPPPHDGPPGMQRQGSIPQPRPMPPGAGPFGAGPLGTRSTPATPVNGGPFPAPPNPPFASVPHRPPSDPSFQGGLRKAASSHGLNAQYDSAPPVPGFLQRRSSQTSLTPSFSATLPSARLANSRSPSMRGNGGMFSDSPPASPEANAAELPPEKVTSSVSATMKCKVYLKQQHAQWKALGSAKLKLWKQEPGNVKQLVVEADDRQKSTLISTIVLTDGVERVGKTGVAVELSDRGARTGIVYMIQLRNEQSCVGLYESLLAGSDRAG